MHALTQRVTDWFDSRTGQTIQSVAASKWFGQMEPRAVRNRALPALLIRGARPHRKGRPGRDIDRGGVFASLLGTWEWLADDERALVRGFVLNKFRGDAALLALASALLDERTGVPVRGVVPFIKDLLLPEDDAASLSQREVANAIVDIAVIRLPHLANFDEFGSLAMEPPRPCPIRIPARGAPCSRPGDPARHQGDNSRPAVVGRTWSG